MMTLEKDRKITGKAIQKGYPILTESVEKFSELVGREELIEVLKRIIKNILIGNVDLENQQLSKDTINILAVINYKFGVKDDEHKKDY